MGANNADDMDALLAQIEKEYEEEENRQKKEKKSKKKGGKVVEEKADDKGAQAADVAGDEEQKENVPKNETAASKKNKGKDNKKKDKDEVKKDENLKESVAEETAEKPKPAPKEPEKDQKKKAKKDAKPVSATEKPAKDEPAKQAEATKPVEAKAEPADDKSKGKKKKPSGALKLVKEALQKQQEIENELQRQEEERIRKEEEQRKKLEEQERLEKERKEKKKLKEKQRIERLKQEGKYLTKAQKESKERALRQLEALGVQIPQKTDDATTAEEKKRKPKAERLRKTKQQTQQDATGEAQDEEAEAVTDEVKKEDEAVANVPEVKDRWDEESEESEGEKEKTKEAHAEGSGSEDEEDEDENEEDEDESSAAESESEDELPPIVKAKLRIQKRNEEAEKERSVEKLREPVICVLGHVDTGKTKILDNLRRTRVQDDEVGGITQQIGATNVPLETIQERTKMCKHIYKNLIKIPGFLIIDTPGHESFKSLRNRGSSLCDIAILVIDIMHGLEPQTIESIGILREKKTPFVVALNKIDRLFDFKSNPHSDVEEVLKKQPANTRMEFEKRTNEIILQLNEKGLNAALYYNNPDPKTYISLVPTSAHSSDGIGNIIALIVEFCQTMLPKRLSFTNQLQCSVLEVKVIPSLGTTIDVCLVNGKLKVCDTIIVAGQEGPIVTQIRGLLMPQPNRELRVKNSYVTYKEIVAARGIKIAAKGLDKAMPGLPLFVAEKEDEIEYYKEELQVMLKNVLSSIRLSDLGVFVQASTLGSLEALLEFLRTSKIPYAGINIGPIHKKDITRASIMLERDPQWAVILAFDVKVERDAQDLAEHLGVTVFTADIIYHLFDKFIGYREELKRKKRDEFKDIAVFPCKLKILPEFIFNSRDPIVIGVRIESGFLKINTPIVALCEHLNDEIKEIKEKFVDLGRITSIEINHKPIEVAKQGQEVCIKIDNTTGGAPKMLGRHFTESDTLLSKISRESIDAVKDYFREEMSKSDWQLIIELKKLFQII